MNFKLHCSFIKDLEVKLARAKEEADASERQLKGAKEDRENAGVQLQQMQEEFRSMMDDRNQSLQRWEQNLVQTSLSNQQLEISRKVEFC
jgi:chromosome segregation and condensation protein ScpB